MYGKGRVNGDLFQQFYCRFLPRGVLQGEIISEGKKAASTFSGRHLTGDCVLVVSNFSLLRLGSLVVCLQSLAIQSV